ncbi:MaoC family dehydratase [Bosea vaviloviae]|uniref:Acyl dehydratase n=1 Tax=Bosea vaviloviae TaxID=1526658 RepID=A0A1D7UBA3_9HYPH|nr:MaoC/PaaZ C-terminal domain-containing protein [Bosea vaviloviae]AOO84667.1 acyl dehydratase [Bosea vaviloviae]
MSGRELPAGEYWFEDLEEGDRYQTGFLVVTEAHIVSFAGLSGDFFDIHMDDDFARSQGFPARVAHGLLGLALTDGLKNRASVRIMAVASLGWNWRFKGPIFAGDRIGAQIRVAGKRLSSKGQGIVTLAFEVVKRDGEIAQEGDTTLLTRLRPQAPERTPA